jgi:Cu/Ag efflux pump CusA
MFTPEELGEVVVRKGSPVVRLRDVARVVLGAEPKFGDTLVMAKPAVLLTLRGQYGTNTLEVTRALEAALAELQPVFEKNGIRLFPRLHRPATFIETALANVGHSLLIGGALVGIVLLLFLLDLRPALISFLSIPLSLLTAVLMLDWFGVSLNTMTLGGFAVAIGVVVDDAIIDVENILRRLRENAALARRARSGGWCSMPPSRCAARSCMPRSSSASSSCRCSRCPACRALLRAARVAFILSTLASLGVALTVTPALCLMLLGGAKQHDEPRGCADEGAAPRLVPLFRPLAARDRARRARARRRRARARARLWRRAAAGVPRRALRRAALAAARLVARGNVARRQNVSEQMLALDRIATVEQQVGRAEQGEDTWGPHKSEFHIELKRGTIPEQEVATQEALRHLLEETPGISSECSPTSGDRIRRRTISRRDCAGRRKVFGDDLGQARRHRAPRSKPRCSCAATADVQVKAPPGCSRASPCICGPERLTQFGFQPLPSRGPSRPRFRARMSPQMVLGNRIHELAVILDDEARRDPEAVANLLLTNGDGLRVAAAPGLRHRADEWPPEHQHEGARAAGRQ